jgi:hypothetical protein
MAPDEARNFFAVLIAPQKNAAKRVQPTRAGGRTQKNAVPMLVCSTEFRPSTTLFKAEMFAAYPFAVEHVAREKEIARQRDRQGSQ